MNNISPMPVKRLAVLLTLLLIAAGCAVTPQQAKIALLAPFEGRYREVGYDALYATRLAIREAGYDGVTLLAIDDGGTIEHATARASAITQDEAIQAVLILGTNAASEAVLAALEPVPTIIVGHWRAVPAGEHVAMLAGASINDQLTAHPDLNELDSVSQQIIHAGEILALKQLPLLTDKLDAIRIWTSASLPDDAFIERYRASDPFAPEPGILAPLTYDATRIAINLIRDQQTLHAVEYSGINGRIVFDEQGYWLDAPLYQYRYDDTGTLIPVLN